MNEKITQITSILIIGLLSGAGILAIIVFSPLDQGAYTYKLNNFQSYDELLKFLQKRYETDVNQERYFYSLNANIEKSDGSTTGATQESGESNSYSKTNVQVAGVDEPDIVKTDGIYIYVVAKQKVFIIEAYPPEEAYILSTITITNVSISNIFIREDKLVVFGETNGYLN